MSCGHDCSDSLPYELKEQCSGPLPDNMCTVAVAKFLQKYPEYRYRAVDNNLVLDLEDKEVPDYNQPLATVIPFPDRKARQSRKTIIG